MTSRHNRMSRLHGAARAASLSARQRVFEVFCSVSVPTPARMHPTCEAPDPHMIFHSNRVLCDPVSPYGPP